jgi:hypothetical protein
MLERYKEKKKIKNLSYINPGNRFKLTKEASVIRKTPNAKKNNQLI